MNKLLLSLCRPWQKGSRSSSSSLSEQLASFNNLQVFKYEELKKATKDFSSETQLGNGFFVGLLPDPSTCVAVRILPTNNIISDVGFDRIVWWIKDMHHINLVGLIGYCYDDHQVDFRLLVFDYFPNRSLDLHLFQPPLVLDWNRRYHIALGTARALAHLHSPDYTRIRFGTQAVHGSISPENIVLDSNFCPKVSDYGLSYILASSTTAITSSYVAPEVLSGSVMTHKSDVYSYGIILFELVSGIRNCENGETPKSFPTRVASVIMQLDGHDDNINILSMLLDGRLAGDINADEEDVLRVCKVACWCVHHDPNRRPHMYQVDVLEGVIDQNIIDLSSWS